MDSRVLASADPAALLRHLKILSFERSPMTHPGERARAFDYLAEEFRHTGLQVEVDAFEVGGEKFRNLLGFHPGRSTASPWIVLAAHVDAVMGSPGADDNASGLAALLECARLVSRRELDFTICYAAVDLEEYGMHGSRHLAARLKQEGIDVRAMLSLEMVGYTDPRPGAQKYPVVLRPFYPSTGDFIALVANWKSRNLLRNVATVFRQVPELPVQTLAVPGNGWLLPVSRLSDHAPFWDHGFPALMVTDTAFLRNPHYHQPTDTIETIDLSFLGRVTEALSQVTSMKEVPQ